MKKIIYFIIAGYVFCTLSCSENPIGPISNTSETINYSGTPDHRIDSFRDFSIPQKPTGVIIMKALFNSWEHSYEEDADSVMIFRPIGYKEFPLSRFRQIFGFRKNFTANYLVLAPNDAHYIEEGKWEYDTAKRILIIRDQQQNPIFRYKVLIAQKNILKVVEINN